MRDFFVSFKSLTNFARKLSDIQTQVSWQFILLKRINQLDKWPLLLIYFCKPFYVNQKFRFDRFSLRSSNLLTYEHRPVTASSMRLMNLFENRGSFGIQTGSSLLSQNNGRLRQNEIWHWTNPHFKLQIYCVQCKAPILLPRFSFVIWTAEQFYILLTTNLFILRHKNCPRNSNYVNKFNIGNSTKD